MKTIIFGALMLIASVSFGQNLINTTSCSIYVRGRVAPQCNTPYGPVCLAPGAAIPLPSGVEELTAHYRCNPECGPGASVGIPGNCNGTPMTITINTGTCCGSTTLTFTYDPFSGDYTAS